MPFFEKHEPVFVKDDISATIELDVMKALLPRVAKADQFKLERDIMLVKAGIVGEECVAFELRNSHMPICVLRDLYLEHQGLSAQIDFMVFMPYVNVVLECKNLVGDIEVNSRGDFIRTFGSGKYRRKEGIYSPITQNERHLQLIRAIRRDWHSAFMGALFDRNFDKIWKSVVVLANPKSVLNDRFAKKQIKCQIVHADGLIAQLKELESAGKAAGNVKVSLKNNKETAQRWLAEHIEHKIDLEKRYQLITTETATRFEESTKTLSQTPSQQAPETPPAVSPEVVLCPICGAPMVKRIARQGKHTGQQFWGCSTYPKCRGIVNIKQ